MHTPNIKIRRQQPGICCLCTLQPEIEKRRLMFENAIRQVLFGFAYFSFGFGCL
jgi:hypothetical protein